MALTAAGNALTTAHRAQQLAVRAGNLEGLVRLWAVVDPTRLGDTIETFARAAAILAGSGFDQSAAAAANYYGLFRRVELGTAVEVRAAVRPGVEFLAGELRGAALKGIIDARRGGRSLSAAKQNGLVRVVGAFSKLVMAGGRMTITNGVQTDRKALGWSRVTSGDPCVFCRMIASRGPAYKTERSADFQPHDHCGCTPEPLFDGDPLETSKSVEQSGQYLGEFDTAQAWARENVRRSRTTSNNALNNYRQWLAAGQPEPGQPTAGNAGDDGSNPGGN